MKRIVTAISMTIALASGVPVATSVASAESGPPQQGGGCNMVFGPAFHSPNSGGLENMMSGSGGSQDGVGAANMQDMLGRFSPYASTFCFAP